MKIVRKEIAAGEVKLPENKHKQSRTASFEQDLWLTYDDMTTKFSGRGRFELVNISVTYANTISALKISVSTQDFTWSTATIKDLHKTAVGIAIEV